MRVLLRRFQLFQKENALAEMDSIHYQAVYIIINVLTLIHQTNLFNC